jgi:hypothetical protein
MAIAKYSAIQTLEVDQYSLNDLPKISAGTAYSSWFDCVGLTLFGIAYPLNSDAYQFTLETKDLSVPSLGDLTEDFSTVLGLDRTWIAKKTSKINSDATIFSFEPAISAGTRFFRIWSLDSDGYPTNESADRIFIPKARRIP